jgi:hemerythrin superfamily protein
VLAEQAEHHHEEEEENLFPKAKKLMDEAQREVLGAEMSKRMAQLLESSPRERIRTQTDDSVALA